MNMFGQLVQVPDWFCSIISQGQLMLHEKDLQEIHEVS